MASIQKHLTVACTLFMSSQICFGVETTNSCEFSEMQVAKHDVSDKVLYEYTLEGVSLKITDDWSAGVLNIKDESRQASECKLEINSDSLPRIYANNKTVAIQLIEISSNDLSFYDIHTCKKVRKSLHFGVSDDHVVSGKLAQLHICQDQSNKGGK